MVTALRHEGLHVVGHPGWRTHNRNSKGPWGPVNGVIIHHTAGRNSTNTLYTGRSDLPGPLAHAHLAKTGRITLVGHGRANHAGLAARNAYDTVIHEAAHHPQPKANSGTVDGNTHFYGLEIENLGDGRDPYPEAQYDAAVRWATAICRAHGWSANSVVGHKETSIEGKVDPSFDMGAFRRAVATRLTHPAGWNPLEDDMDLDDKVRLGDWVTRRWPDDEGVADKKISVETALSSSYAHARAAHDSGDAILAKLSSLETTGLTGEQIDAIATAVATSPALTDKLAEAVAAKVTASLQP
jgi:hypothetical protein